MTIRRAAGPAVRYDEDGRPMRTDAGPGMPRGPEAAPLANHDRAFSDMGRRYFPDVGFPATASQLIASAIAHGAPEDVILALEGLPPDRAFAFPDDVFMIVGDLQSGIRRRFEDRAQRLP